MKIAVIRCARTALQDANTVSADHPNTVNIIFNWFIELNEKVPVEKE